MMEKERIISLIKCEMLNLAKKRNAGTGCGEEFLEGYIQGLILPIDGIYVLEDYNWEHEEKEPWWEIKLIEIDHKEETKKVLYRVAIIEDRIEISFVNNN